MKTIRRNITLAVGALAMTGLVGCGASSGDPSYTPAAYYQTVGDVNDCYYVTSPAEAASLISAGLCPAGSVAYQMPVSWEEEYYDYYSSPAYYNTYIPVSSRSIYVNYTRVSFHTKYSTQITKASSKAVYKSSSGGTVSGSKVAIKSFGGGSRTSSGSGYGGGSRSGGGSSSYGKSSGSSGSYGSRK